MNEKDGTSIRLCPFVDLEFMWTTDQYDGYLIVVMLILVSEIGGFINEIVRFKNGI